MQSPYLISTKWGGNLSLIPPAVNQSSKKSEDQRGPKENSLEIAAYDTEWERPIEREYPRPNPPGKPTSSTVLCCRVTMIS